MEEATEVPVANGWQTPEKLRSSRLLIGGISKAVKVKVPVFVEHWPMTHGGSR